MKSCLSCQHYSVCSSRRAQHEASVGFIRGEDLQVLHDTYNRMGEKCLYYLAQVPEPEFKDDWFKIARTTYRQKISELTAAGMPEDSALLCAFREAILAAVKSDNFLSLARQVSILHERLAQFETGPKP